MTKITKPAASAGLILLFIFLAAFAAHARAESARAESRFAGGYAAADLTGGTLDYEIGDIGEAGGANLGFAVSAGHRGPIGGRLPIYLGSEISFAFATMDEEETTTPIAVTVPDESGAMSCHSLGSAVGENADTACPGGSVRVSQHYAVEETWNISASAELGLLVNPNFLAFVRVGYVFAGGAEAEYIGESVEYDDIIALGGNDPRDPRNVEAQTQRVIDAADGSDNQIGTADDDVASFASREVEEADNSVLFAVGGQYRLDDITRAGISARGLVAYHSGDRSGVSVSIGAVWDF